jgi:heptosyltransferase-2
MTAASPPAAPRRLLVRGVNWLGDAVMTTPALLRLREAMPATHIALLSPAKIAELWRGHLAVDEVLAVPPGTGLWSVGAHLRAGRFDAALVLPNSQRSALETWLARIPRRIGYARPWRNWLLTDAVPERPGRVKMHKRSNAEIRQLLAAPPVAAQPPPSSAHQIYEYLHLVELLGARPDPLLPRLEVSAAEVTRTAAKFGLTPDAVWLGLNPGAEYGPAKRWPQEFFIETAAAVQARTGCRCVIFGGQGDTELAAVITRGLCAAAPGHPPPVNLAGQTTLRELSAALRTCRVLLTNDTGPMHMAAALGVPVVVPFGSTSSELTGPGLPGGREHRFLRVNAPCSPCFRRECPVDFRCLKGLSPERVIPAVLEIMAARNAG